MDPSIRAAAIAKANDRCQGCGNPLRGQGAIHHRQAKGMGGPGKKGLLDYPENLLVLHTRCHEWAHRNVLEARRVGWIVPSWDDPTTRPVTMHTP